MNFLSHYYFDRHSSDPNRVIGTVLPDLVKNARKDWVLHPEKSREKFSLDSALESLLTGWKRHLEVDKYFHSSDFFKHHTNNLRTAVLPILEHSPARPSFVAHIALELMLDGLLITEQVLHPKHFYGHLNSCSRPSLQTFLELNQIDHPSMFFNFLDEFIESEYLSSYREATNITYALNRICMRVWNTPFTETQKLQLTAVLIRYQEKLKDVYMDIFDEIERKMN